MLVAYSKWVLVLSLSGSMLGALCHPCPEMCLCVHGLPSVWTQESTCHLIETNIRDQEELEGKRVPQYPCLWVNVSAVGRWAVLYHTEDTRDQNQQVLTGVGGEDTSFGAWWVHACPQLAPEPHSRGERRLDKDKRS